MINIFQNLIQIELDLFEELVLDNLVSNTLIQNKKICIVKKKNTIGSVQIGFKTIEEEKKEKGFRGLGEHAGLYHL